MLDELTQLGGLTTAQLTRAIPVTASLYGEAPFYYRNFQSVTFVYRTDAEQLARHLPPGLSPHGAEPLVSVVVSDFTFSTFGAYRECAFVTEVDFTAEDGSITAGSYAPYVYVTTEPPLAGGRELWGYCKKLATIELGQEAEVIWATVNRPSPARLFTGTLKVGRPAELSEFTDSPIYSLRVIPSTDPERYPPDVAQLVEARFPTVPRVGSDGMPEAWFGETASLTFEARSAVDPVHCLPVKEVVGGYWGVFDATLYAGTVLRNYSGR